MVAPDRSVFLLCQILKQTNKKTTSYCPSKFPCLTQLHSNAFSLPSVLSQIFIDWSSQLEGDCAVLYVRWKGSKPWHREWGRRGTDECKSYFWGGINSTWCLIKCKREGRFTMSSMFLAGLTGQVVQLCEIWNTGRIEILENIESTVSNATRSFLILRRSFTKSLAGVNGRGSGGFMNQPLIQAVQGWWVREGAVDDGKMENRVLSRMPSSHKE